VAAATATVAADGPKSIVVGTNLARAKATGDANMINTHIAIPAPPPIETLALYHIK
jgi:hypothetical protein